MDRLCDKEPPVLLHISKTSTLKKIENSMLVSLCGCSASHFSCKFLQVFLYSPVKKKKIKDYLKLLIHLTNSECLSRILASQACESNLQNRN